MQKTDKSFNEIDNWIDLYNMTPDKVKNLPEDKLMDWINLVIRQQRRNKTKCSRLPLYIYKIKELYEESTGMRFVDLWASDECRCNGRVITRALNGIRKHRGSKTEDDIINYDRDIEELSLADMELIDSCLKYSLRYEFLLVHYNEQAIWGNRAFDKVDAWNVYCGIFQECRSPVLNLFSMEYALLPYSKFRNIGEAEEYSEENIRKRIKNAEVVEVSDKLDGSMIQISNLHDDRFWNGCLVATSGSLYPEKSPQLKDALNYLKKHDEFAYFLDSVSDKNTYIFEWIDKNDLHIVNYNREQYGLHLIGLRNRENGYLYPVSHAIQLAEEYSLQTTELYCDDLSGILQKRNDYKSSEKEGYVLYADGFQVKIKCTDFIGMARTVQSIQSFNTILKCIVDNTIDDIISCLPEGYIGIVKETAQRIYDFETKMLSRVEAEYQNLPITSDRKTVMIHIENNIDDPYGLIKNLVRAKYLGNSLEILAKRKLYSIQYISEKTIRQYEEILG